MDRIHDKDMPPSVPARDLGALPSNFWLSHVGLQWANPLMLTGNTKFADGQARVDAPEFRDEQGRSI